MRRKVVHGIVAGAAALSVATGGVTYAAFSDFAAVNDNSVGAGILRLQLGAGGTGQVPLTFADLKPDADKTVVRTIWVASDPVSAPAADMSVTFDNLADAPGDCSLGVAKALAEVASGITGCTLTSSGATGSVQGNLSRVLSFRAVHYEGIDAAGCEGVQNGAAAPVAPAELFPSTRGNLHGIAADPGSTFPITRLVPGAGSCIAISATWTPSPAATGTPDAPTDAAAQGDRLTFDVRFDLEQA